MAYSFVQVLQISLLLLFIRGSTLAYAPPECPKPRCDPNYKYQSYDGTCNNLNNPEWGSVGSQYLRGLPAEYEGRDGNTMRGEGRYPPLPLPRTLSFSLSEATLANPRPSRMTLLAMAWGQFISHDMMRSQSASDNNCHCNDGTLESRPTDANCKPLDVSQDPIYSTFNIECLPFVRNQACENCTGGDRQQINTLTSYIDGSTIYGTSEIEANNLRTHYFGMLKIGSEMEETPDGLCPLACPLTFPPSEPDSSGRPQFLVGDSARVEMQPSLTAFHVMFVRVHNDIARRLAYKYPFWDDEILFQESRRVVIALIQKITYYEFLLQLLGKSNWQKFKLNRQYANNYDPHLDATLENVFSAAAYRFGHSIVDDTFELESGQNLKLYRSFFNHNITLTKGSYPSDFVVGLSKQRSANMDHIFAKSLRDKLFAKFPFIIGRDLYSINIKRGRDRGIPSYNKWREFCQLPKFKTFHGLAKVMPHEVVQVFREHYNSVNDIDLYPAGIAETPVGGSFLGPTFTCLVGKQFARLRRGDRFFYENRAQPVPFTHQQLVAIKNTRLVHLIYAYMLTDPKEQVSAFVFSYGSWTLHPSALYESLPYLITNFW